jgi:cytoskeletal protein CcmA (bactofilin family)
MARADTTVTGTRGAITIDDTIEIPAGATATLNGTIVKGDVKVYRNASFIANGARIEGNVQADLVSSPSASLVKLDLNTRVDGDVQGKYTRTVIVQALVSAATSR